jgi:hypothetical protein
MNSRTEIVKVMANKISKIDDQLPRALLGSGHMGYN